MRVFKKQRTRTALVDAAAADVSPRTLTRYITTKDAVFVAVLCDFADAVTTELCSQPTEFGPLRAMRAALGPFSWPQTSPIPDPVTASSAPSGSSPGAARQRAAVEYRGPHVLEAMAYRMNVAIDDHRLDLGMALISVTVVHAWSTLDVSNEPLTSQLIEDQIDRAFDEFASFAAALGATGN